MRILILVFTLVSIATPPHSKAEDSKTWVGKKVMFKEPTHSPLATGDPQEPVSSRVFLVKRANRDLLYIVAGKARLLGAVARSAPSRKHERLSRGPDTTQSPRRAGTLHTGVFPAGEEGIRRCDRRFRRCDQAHPEGCPGVLRPSHLPGTQEGFRQGDRRFRRGHSTDPRLAGAYNGRTWLLATCTDARFRDAPKAIESARKACELTASSRRANCLDTLAAAYAEGGDFAGAVKAQTEANDLFSGDEQRKRGRAGLILYQEKKPYRE